MKVRDVVETSKNKYKDKYTYIDFCICNEKEEVYLSASFINEFDDRFFGDREVIRVTETEYGVDFISIFIYIDEIPDSEFDEDSEKGIIDVEFGMYMAVCVSHNRSDPSIILLKGKTLREAQCILINKYNAKREKHDVYTIRGKQYSLLPVYFDSYGVYEFSDLT